MSSLSTPPPTATKILELANTGDRTIEQIAPFYAFATALRVCGLTVAQLGEGTRDPEQLIRRAWFALILIDYCGFEIRPLVRAAEWLPVDPTTVLGWRKRLPVTNSERLRVAERRVLADFLLEISQPGKSIAPSPASAHPVVPFRGPMR